MAKRSLKYKVVVAPSVQQLEDDVNIALKSGWLPLGAPVIDSGSIGSTRFYQALILQLQPD
jgi:hypothetical protein